MKKSHFATLELLEQEKQASRLTSLKGGVSNLAGIMKRVATGKGMSAHERRLRTAGIGATGGAVGGGLGGIIAKKIKESQVEPSILDRIKDQAGQLQESGSDFLGKITDSGDQLLDRAKEEGSELLGKVKSTFVPQEKAAAKKPALGDLTSLVE